MIVTTTNFYRLDKHRKWPDSISWGGASTNEVILHEEDTWKQYFCR